MAIEKLRSHKSPGVDQTPAESINAGGGTIRSEIHNLFLFGIRSGRSRSLYLFIRRVIKQTGVLLKAYHFGNYYKILSNILLSRLTPYAEEITGDCQCGFQCNRSTTDHIFCICQIKVKVK